MGRRTQQFNNNSPENICNEKIFREIFGFFCGIFERSELRDSDVTFETI
jgi:hypothetical protein